MVFIAKALADLCGCSKLFTSYFDFTAYSNPANNWCLDRCNLHVFSKSNWTWFHTESILFA